MAHFFERERERKRDSDMNQNTVYKIFSVFQMIVNFCIINIFVYNTVPDNYANAKLAFLHPSLLYIMFVSI